MLATHAETEWTAQGRYQGHADVPLSERGLEQAKGLQRRLAAEPIEAIVSSDLRRSRQTAERIASAHAVEPVFEPRLRELHFGQWEGLTYADLQRTDAAAWAAWQPIRFDPDRPAVKPWPTWCGACKNSPMI